MTKEQIKEIQRQIGANDDGVWGRESKTLCRAYLSSLCPNNPWPPDSTAALNAYFGDYGEEGSLTRKFFMNELINQKLNVEKYGFKYGGKKVKTIRCHKLVAYSLIRIFDEMLAKGYGYIFEEYNGCLEIRDQRGSTKPSRHSWGIAIDFMASTNGLKTPWPEKADMPFEVVEIFAKQGFMSGGVAWGRDMMHFQSTKYIK